MTKIFARPLAGRRRPRDPGASKRADLVTRHDERRRVDTAKATAVLGIGAAAGVATYLAVRQWRASHAGQSLPVVADVDLARFSGTWYEQARLPNRFQRHSGGQTSVHYSLRSDGVLDVIDRWVGRNGYIEEHLGVARAVPVVGVRRAGRLSAYFGSAWLGWLPSVWRGARREYWVIDLDEDDQYALLGTPDRKYLWVLSRRPRLQAAKVRELLEYAAILGFPVRRVIRSAI